MKLTPDISEDETFNIKQSIGAIPIFSKFSDLMRETSGALMKSHNLSEITQDDFGRGNVLRGPIQTLGGEESKTTEYVYE